MGVASAPSGEVFIADTCANRIRKVGTDGVISTFAGSGVAGSFGDGGPATLAQLNAPNRVAVDSQGVVYIADSGNYRVRAVLPGGTIVTVAGNGSSTASGDGGLAIAAGTSAYGLAIDPATDDLLVSDYANHRIRRIGGSVPEVDAPHGDAFASDSCATGSVVSARAYGDTAVRVSTVQADADTRYVCVRADGPAVATGGRFEISGAGVSAPGVPSTDTAVEACATTPGNGAPGPHPAVSASVGDPSDPATYLPVVLDSYAGGSAAWVCVQVGSLRQRVVVPVGVGVTSPTAVFVPDVAGSHLPTPPPPPAKPSGTCGAAGAPLLFDASAGPASVVVHGGPLPLCVRVEGPVNAGGRLDFGENLDGTVPSVTTSTTDMAPCTVQVAGVASPVNVQVRRSPTGAVPASICVTVGADSLRVTVGTGSGGTPADVTWTPDPGTPGLP